jgi:ribosomal protein S18 acetylase RimI-like enzyme
VIARVRAATTGEADAGFLRQMLYEAAVWRAGGQRPALDAVLSNQKLSAYVDGWGREDDFGVIAEAEGGRAVGAARYRFFGEDAHGFGFVSATIPEITIGVSPGSRARGVGTTLLAALVEHAQQAQVPAPSLSVEEDNPAVRLYERLGFRRVGRVDNAWTMRLDLADRSSAAVRRSGT